MKAWSLFVLQLLLTLCLQAQHREAVQVNQGEGNSLYPNEPSVCVARPDGGNRVVCANINYHFHSQDGGRSWHESRIHSDLGVWGDPVLHATPNGKIYLAHLSYTAGKKHKYGYIDRIVVQRSDDSGRTFQPGSGLGLNGDKMQDKPWLSSDDYSLHFGGNLYCSWTEFDKINSPRRKHRSRIRFSKSSDQADTWSQAITVSDGTGGSRDDDNTLEGATTCADRHGNLYCVWAGHNKLYFDRSTDGGTTWAEDRVIARQKAGWVMEIPHVFRCNGMPFLGVDNSGGPFDGRLYVVYGDTAGNDSDIFIIHSSDQGLTWTEPKQINGDHIIPKDQYLPNFSIDQTSGKLYVVFQDRRWDDLNIFTHSTLAVGEPGAGSWKEYRITSAPTPPHGKKQFSGDYNDVDAFEGQIAAVWTEFENGSKIYGFFGTEKDLGYINDSDFEGCKTFAYREKNRYFVAVYGSGGQGCEIQVFDSKGEKLLRSHSIVPSSKTTPYSALVELGKMKRRKAALLQEVHGKPGRKDLNFDG